MFDISDARTIDEVSRIVKDGKLDGIMLPIDQIFKDMETVFVIPTEDAIKHAVNGVPNPISEVFAESISGFEDDRRYRVYLPDNRFIGVYSFKNNIFTLEKMFLE